jgi:hypothetical protein
LGRQMASGAQGEALAQRTPRARFFREPRFVQAAKKTEGRRRAREDRTAPTPALPGAVERPRPARGQIRGPLGCIASRKPKNQAAPLLGRTGKTLRAARRLALRGGNERARGQDSARPGNWPADHGGG